MRRFWRPSSLGSGASTHLADDTERMVLIVVGVALLTGGAVLAFTGVLAIVGIPMMAVGLVALARGVV